MINLEVRPILDAFMQTASAIGANLLAGVLTARAYNSLVRL